MIRNGKEYELVDAETGRFICPQCDLYDGENHSCSLLVTQGKECMKAGNWNKVWKEVKSEVPKH